MSTNRRGARPVALPVALAMLGAVATFSESADARHRHDHYWARRSDRMVEHSHKATLKLRDGYAEMVVRRTVRNDGVRNDEANFDIYLPPEAVAVGLRTLALKDGRPHWYRGELMEAEAAAQKYLELTGIGGAYPKDPALLSWRSRGHLRLQVFPCPPNDYKSVEYSLLMPTEYRGGRHVLTLPRFGTETIAADVRLAASAAGALYVEGERAFVGHPLAFDQNGRVRISLALRRQPTLGGKLAAVPAGARAINRVRIEASPKLSAVPKRARVVMILDISRSYDEADVEASRRAALAYLGHLPDARVEVITFARDAKRRHGRFVAAAKAITDLRLADLSRHNGSFVDHALSLADSILKQGQGPARIVLFTDTRTRMALRPAQLRAMLGSHALLHIVHARDGGITELARDDDHDWAAVAKSTGGLYWTANIDSGPARKVVIEELVRPIRLHNFAMAGRGFAVDECAVPLTLDEGEGVVCSQIGSETTSWVAATGELWNQRVRLRLTPDKAESDRWAALVFGNPDHHELTEEEMMPIAMRGGAVSPVTSYLAIEPGVRPSTDGLEHGRLGRSWRARPPRVRMGHASVSGMKPTFDGHAYLVNAFVASWLRCGGAGKRAHIKLETDLHEIADVTHVSSDQAGAKQVRCLAEAVWAEPLPKAFDQEQATWDVKI